MSNQYPTPSMKSAASALIAANRECAAYQALYTAASDFAFGPAMIFASNQVAGAACDYSWQYHQAWRESENVVKTARTAFMRAMHNGLDNPFSYLTPANALHYAYVIANTPVRDTSINFVSGSTEYR